MFIILYKGISKTLPDVVIFEQTDTRQKWEEKKCSKIPEEYFPGREKKTQSHQDRNLLGMIFGTRNPMCQSEIEKEGKR